MDEKTFLSLADEALARLETAIETAAEKASVDIDIESMSGGVLQLGFENGSVVVINRHALAQEIWVAARTGGFHFRPEAGRWSGTRDGADLYTVLSELLTQHAEKTVTLLP